MRSDPSNTAATSASATATAVIGAHGIANAYLLLLLCLL
jgi:hypothetical protein